MRHLRALPALEASSAWAESPAGMELQGVTYHKFPPASSALSLLETARLREGAGVALGGCFPHGHLMAAVWFGKRPPLN